MSIRADARGPGLNPQRMQRYTGPIDVASGRRSTMVSNWRGAPPYRETLHKVDREAVHAVAVSLLAGTVTSAPLRRYKE